MTTKERTDQVMETVESDGYWENYPVSDADRRFEAAEDDAGYTAEIDGLFRRLLDGDIPSGLSQGDYETLHERLGNWMKHLYETGRRNLSAELTTRRDDLSEAFFQEKRDRERREVEDRMSALVRRAWQGKTDG